MFGRSLLPSLWRQTDVAKREAENPFVSIQREMNRLFDDFFGGLNRYLLKNRWGDSFRPSISKKMRKNIPSKPSFPGWMKRCGGDLGRQYAHDQRGKEGRKRGVATKIITMWSGPLVPSNGRSPFLIM